MLVDQHVQAEKDCAGSTGSSASAVGNPATLLMIYTSCQPLQANAICHCCVNVLLPRMCCCPVSCHLYDDVKHEVVILYVMHLFFLRVKL
jgi:hypothetical protein